MFNMTSDERRVILFLSFLILLSCGINVLAKVYPSAEKIVLKDKSLGKLNLNSVNIQDLKRLNVIPDKLAQKIIEYRTSVLKFSNLEELKEVKGIGDSRYERLKEYFYLE